MGIMGMGTSLILITVGAIMRFAITAQGTGFDIQTIGLILMIVGLVGFVISVIFWTSAGGFGARRYPYRGRTVVTRTDQDYVAPPGAYGHGAYGYPPGTVPPPGAGVPAPAVPVQVPRRTTVVEEDDRNY